MEQTPQHGRIVEKDIFIKASPERVFRALTEAEDLERWFVQKAEIDLRPGGAIRLEWGPGSAEVGTIQVLEPPYRLSFTWEALEPSPTTVDFVLTAESGGTRLHLRHSGIGAGDDWDTYYSSVDGGWEKHLGAMTAWLETGAVVTPGPTGNLTNA